MPGVAQVWLTHDELEAIASTYDAVQRLQVLELTPDDHAALSKIERALAPVACEIASGPKTPAGK